MPEYPLIESEHKIDHRILVRFVKSIFIKCAMRDEDAALLSELLVNADLRGCHSHGVLRVPEYVKKLIREGVDPRGVPEVVRESHGAIVIDGNNSMGQIGCYFAMNRAIEKAKKMGITFAGIQGSNHCGALADYVMLACESDMIGIAGTNALPTMAPYGGVEKILGINPIAIGIPAGKHHDLIFDAAFSASSHGKIRVYHQKGVRIPDGWAFDVHGQPTVDTSAAMEGTLQPIGGYKGTGLALMVGLISTLLTNASYGTDLGNMVEGPRPGKDGHFCIAINISAFTEIKEFKSKVDRYIDQIRNSKPKPGTTRIYPPGALEAETKEKNLVKGIPLNDQTLHDLKNTGRELGLNTDHLILIR